MCVQRTTPKSSKSAENVIRSTQNWEDFKYLKEPILGSKPIYKLTETCADFKLSFRV